MLDNKNIKDLFNNASLEDQDWLEPSDSVFSGIEEAIYKNEEEKKPLLFWLVGVSLTLCCLCISTWALNKNKPPSKSLKIENQNSNQNTEAITSNELTSNAILDVNAIKEVGNDPNNLYDRSVVESQNNDLKNASSPQIISSNKLNTQSNQLKISTPNTNKLSTTSDKPPTEEISSLNKSKNTVTEKKSATTPNNNSNKSNGLKSTLPTRLSNTPKELIYKRNTIINNQKIDPIVESTFESFASLKVGVGTSIWNFHLNDNYSSALNPADFSYSNGIGVNLNIAYEKTIAPSIAIISTVTLEKIKYQSGHNSAVTYDTNSELIDQENEFDLTMASPMGFLESQVVVQRSIDSTDPQSDLILDLHNEHENYNVDFNIAMLRQLISTKSFSTSLHLGVGINHLFGINNKLSEVNINNANYSTTLKNITSNQNNINPTRPYYNIGLNSQKRITSNIGVGLNALYMRDFTSVYSDQDFSTMISRYMVHASLNYIF